MKTHERILKICASSAVDSKSIRRRFEFYSRIACKYSIFRKLGELPILLFLKLSTGAINKKIYRKSINNYLRNYFNIYFKVLGLLEKSLSYYSQPHGDRRIPELKSESFSNTNADLQGALWKNRETLLYRNVWFYFQLPGFNVESDYQAYFKNASLFTKSIRTQHPVAKPILHYITPQSGIYLQGNFNADFWNAGLSANPSFLKNASLFTKSIRVTLHHINPTFDTSIQRNFKTYVGKDSSKLNKVAHPTPRAHLLNKEKQSSELPEGTMVLSSEKITIPKISNTVMQESEVQKTISPETKEYGEHGKNNLILARNILISNTQRMSDGVAKRGLSTEVFSPVHVKNSQIANHVERASFNSKNSINDNSPTDLIFRKTVAQETGIVSENKEQYPTEKITSTSNNFHENIQREKSIGKIDVIADRVYKIIERRIAIEIDRRGLSNGS